MKSPFQFQGHFGTFPVSFLRILTAVGMCEGHSQVWKYYDKAMWGNMKQANSIIVSGLFLILVNRVLRIMLYFQLFIVNG